MLLPHQTVAAVGLLAFTLGCASTPLESPPPPALQAVPTFEEYQERTFPGAEDLTTRVNFPQTPTDPEVLKEGVSTRPNDSVPVDARIVISVPVEEQLREERHRPPDVEGQASDGEGVSHFKTTGYFNLAEQQLVRSLLGKGFTVVDRSKFEAQLRDQREESNRSYYRRNSEAKDAEVEAAENKKEAGVITVDEWAKELAQIEKKYATRATDGGRKPGQAKELVDNSELIRAAQTGDAQADFILQVNTFKTAGIADERLLLTSFKEIEEVCQANPGLRTALDHGGHGIIIRPGFFAYLNAQLIDVQSGAIVWVGEHRVATENVLNGGFTIKLPASRQVSNGTQLNEEIRAYNQGMRDRGMAASALKAAIESGQYEPAADEDATQASPLSERVAEYNGLVSELSEMIASDGPEALLAPLEYSYVVESIELQPILPTAADLLHIEERYKAESDTQKKAKIREEYNVHHEFLTAHFAALAKMAAKELIATIPTE